MNGDVQTRSCFVSLYIRVGNDLQTQVHHRLKVSGEGLVCVLTHFRNEFLFMFMYFYSLTVSFGDIMNFSHLSIIDELF